VSPISICFAAISDKGSSYTSPYILLEYEVGAKRIVESMESSRDRVEVRTFLCAMLNNVGNLNSSGSVAKQYCSGIVLCLSRPQTSIPLSSRNPKGLFGNDGRSGNHSVAKWSVLKKWL